MLNSNIQNVVRKKEQFGYNMTIMPENT